jgi:hypothetical protein
MRTIAVVFEALINVNTRLIVGKHIARMAAAFERALGIFTDSSLTLVYL